VGHQSVFRYGVISPICEAKRLLCRMGIPINKLVLRESIPKSGVTEALAPLREALVRRQPMRGDLRAQRPGSTGGKGALLRAVQKVAV
jgi:hypothetical protein